MDEGVAPAFLGRAAGPTLGAAPPVLAAAAGGRKAALVQTRHLLSDCTGAGAEWLLSTTGPSAGAGSEANGDTVSSSGGSCSAAAEFFQLR